MLLVLFSIVAEHGVQREDATSLARYIARCLGASGVVTASSLEFESGSEVLSVTQ